MAVYNLTGSGVQGLTSGQAQLLVDITSFDVHRSVGRAAPPNYYDLGLLRLGQQGSYRPSFPLDATSMVIDLPDKTDVLGYSLFGTTAIRVTEVAPAAIGNPVRISRGFTLSIPVSQTATLQWTYTVPANRVFRVGLLFCAVAQVQGQVTGSNQLQLNGQNIQYLQPVGSGAATSFVSQYTTVPFYMVAGDKLDCFTAGGSAASTMIAALQGVEFDAATWTPT